MCFEVNYYQRDYRILTHLLILNPVIRLRGMGQREDLSHENGAGEKVSHVKHTDDVGQREDTVHHFSQLQ
jgi:hypothetical protein